MPIFNTANLRVGALLVASAYLGGAPAYAAYDVYVDSVSGSNANDGLTAATAKQTLSAITLAAGLRIGLARGSSWKEQIGSTTVNLNKVIIGAYGTGALPVLNASELSTGWTKTAGKTYVYESVLTIETGSTGQFLRLYENGAPLKWVSSTTLCDAEAGTFYCATCTAATTVTVYVHATGDGNPSSNGKTYEHTARLFGICSGVSTGWVVSDVRTKRNLHADGSLVLYNTGTALRCIAEDGGKHNLFIGLNSLAEDCIAYGCEWATRIGQTMFVGYVGAATGSNVMFRRCVAICDPAIGEQARVAALYGITGFYCHSLDDSNKWASIVYEDCSAKGCTSGFSGQNALLYTEERCYAECCAQASNPGGDVSIITDGYCKEAAGVQNVSGIEVRKAGIVLTIDGFRYYGFSSSSKGALYSNYAATIDLHHSVIWRSGTGYAPGVMCGVNGVALNMHHCIVQGDTTGTLLRKSPDQSGPIDDNVYYPTNAQWQDGVTSYASFALWRAAFPSLDTRTVIGDPLLIDVANGNFALTSGSPAIAMGAGLSRPSIAYTAIPSNAAVAAM